MIEQIFPNVDWANMWEASYETIYMTLISVAFTFVIGLLLGLLLFLTSKENIWENKIVYVITSVIVNVFRSIPFNN